MNETLDRAEERIAVLEQALYGQHEPEEDPVEKDPKEPEEDPEKDPEEVPEEPAEPAEPEELVVAAPSTPVPAAPVPGHQNRFVRMPAHFQVYSRQEHRRGCGGYLSD